MSTITWDQALQGVTPATGGSLPPGTYRLKIIGGEGKENSSLNAAMNLQFEVFSGPLKGRKAFHYENLPGGKSDTDNNRWAYFAGLLEAFGVTGQQVGQMLAGQPVNQQSADYLAKMLVQTGRVVKSTLRPRRADPTRFDWNGWVPDDGIEPEPPVSASQAPVTNPNNAPVFGGQAPQGAPGMPLGGFPGSGGMQPNQAPEWAQQPAAQTQPQQFQATQQAIPGQQPAPQFGGPGQAAPAAQPQAAGMNQFQQPQTAQFPQPGQQNQQNQALQEGFQGQQFPGQVNPAAFVNPNAPTNDPWAAPGEAGFQQQAQAPQQFQQAPQGGQLPGMPPPQQNQPNPNGLPQGGFPQPGQAPQATF